jgi:glycosyltransferase involved in cell wall biosynthesis
MQSLLLVCNLNPNKLGTFERYLVQMGLRCLQDRVRCGLVLAGEPIPPLAELLRAAEVEWWVIPNWNDETDRERALTFVREYVRILRRGPWDVTAFQFCRELTVAAASALARIRGVAPRAVVWIQQSGIVMPGRLGKYLSRMRVLARFAAGMVVLDPAARAAVVARGWSAGRTTVIGNGCLVPAEGKRGWLRSSLDLPENAVVVVAVGSLIERKGYDVLIPAVAPLFIGRPERHLLVVGDGPLKPALTALADSQGIGRHTHFLGLRNDVADLLADANVFALASRAEGLSFAVVEALASGLPVVATDVGGHKEVVTPATGWLVPPSDVAAFRSALDEVVADLPAARTRGVAGSKLVAERFSLEAQVEAQYQYFRSVWQSARARRAISTPRQPAKHGEGR